VAVALALAAALASAPASADSATLSGGGGATFVQQSLSAPAGAFAGRKARVNGHIDNFAGPVSITARRGKKGDFLPVGTANTDADGDFSITWKPPKSGLYNFRIAPLTDAATTSATTASSGSLAVYRRQKATWYGPESYGSRTACGVKLTRRTLGVAHKKLPCGTRVEFFLRGKRIIVPVIDRGPYANGATWDLTLRAMRRLGSSSTEVLGALPLG
jgi:hypothetical protein